MKEFDMRIKVVSHFHTKELTMDEVFDYLTNGDFEIQNILKGETHKRGFFIRLLEKKGI